MARTAHLAIDLGAESGRAIVGVLENGVLTLHEVHRFEHRPVRWPGGLYWDSSGLWHEITRGLTAAARWSRERSTPLRSIGVDTWGVDFALLTARGELVGIPHCYRDERNLPAHRRVLERVSANEIYRTTGVQMMAINSLFQLRACADALGPVLDAAAHLLFMPDFFHFLLSGIAKTEATIASTSQMVDHATGRWATPMLVRAGLPTHPLGEIVPPGTCLGRVRAEVAELTGCDPSMMVVTPGSHDTASAVAAVPADPGSSWAYLSSGTWSLLGVELPAPCVSDAAQAAQFTNEAGVAGTVRFLKNIAGLWVLQECRREYERLGTPLSYAQLTELAGDCEPFRTIVDIDDDPFLSPGMMLGKISAYAAATAQPVPRTPGEVARCCLESLAMKYSSTLATLESIIGRGVDTVHIVGGGGKNRLLSVMTAEATGRRVIVGPFEATAVGNVLVQAMGMGIVTDLRELRAISSASSSQECIVGEKSARWDAARERFENAAARRTSQQV